MKGIRFNKRSLKKITAKHVAIIKRPKIKVVNEIVKTNESPVKETKNISEGDVIEQKKVTKKAKKVVNEKLDDNKETVK